MPGNTRIAVLLTCFNRRETTLRCLRDLQAQEGLEGVALEVFLVDDGCTDGTGDAVRAEFPGVKVLRGDGSLYWCGGMRRAWDEASPGDPDAFLWLNDDTHLFPGALRTMLDTSRLLASRAGRGVLLSGSVQDPETGQTSYGGVVRRGRLQPMGYDVVEPGDEPRPCDTIHGNCVLVPRDVAAVLGNMSSSFTHHLGDFDYGLRGKRAGISSWITAGYVGTCAPHPTGGSFLDERVPMRDRVSMLKRPSGLPPLRPWMVYTYRHAGWLWPWYWLRALIRVGIPRLWLTVRSPPVDR
jgi:GT2 family glycosyltransferase